MTIIDIFDVTYNTTAVGTLQPWDPGDTSMAIDLVGKFYVGDSVTFRISATFDQDTGGYSA
mgnify:CR=1 FL=1